MALRVAKERAVEALDEVGLVLGVGRDRGQIDFVGVANQQRYWGAEEKRGKLAGAVKILIIAGMSRGELRLGIIDLTDLNASVVESQKDVGSRVRPILHVELAARQIEVRARADVPGRCMIDVDLGLRVGLSGEEEHRVGHGGRRQPERQSGRPRQSPETRDDHNAGHSYPLLPNAVITADSNLRARK